MTWKTIRQSVWIGGCCVGAVIAVPIAGGILSLLWDSMSEASK